MERQLEAWAGKAVTRSMWTVPVVVIRTDDILDRHVLIHANYWTFIIYMRVCDALHPFSSGTVGRIWAQSNLSKAFHCVQSHLQKSCSKEEINSLAACYTASPFA